jgi:hypothetical protein
MRGVLDKPLKERVHLAIPLNMIGCPFLLLGLQSQYST